MKMSQPYTTYTFISTCAFFFLPSAALPPPQLLLDLQTQPKSLDQLGAVASENRVCSQIGINLLKAGGNAADAGGHLFILAWRGPNRI